MPDDGTYVFVYYKMTFRCQVCKSVSQLFWMIGHSKDDGLSVGPAEVF